ncbi:M23 family metallopeptidase [Pelagimonas varians]|uniref:Murein DD-endopeptidase MepM n=1 Tax=Pelagimonas varians TaxID=696760 RepID=A0A238L1P1_9RHOB|nr:M23 family metallopeptidase [Pelagimonas varians]PYG26837.1 peptidase M23-like protein [Pelagimonas varians]SMX48858.1 Murein DD-endopeptidase MepM [Pelagimonas varians]
MRVSALALAGAIAACATYTQAEELRLGLPIECEIGISCHISDYVDHNTQPDVQTDHACNFNSRDGHKGTDFALVSYDAYEHGVEIRAAANGTVRAVRDEMQDDRLMRGVTDQNACGNAVVLDHSDGWQTWYCHMKLGSIAVQPGDQVSRGDALGLVGLSGQTNHPHLHFQLLQGTDLVDPFQPGPLDQCKVDSASMWEVPIPYTQTGFLTAGFSNQVPTLKAVSDGTALAERIANSQPIVMFMNAAYAEHGDVLRFSARGPDGIIFDHDMILKSPKIQQMQAFGRKAPGNGWATGDYLGNIWLTRKGKIIAHRFTHLVVE